MIQPTSTVNKFLSWCVFVETTIKGECTPLAMNFAEYVNHPQIVNHFYTRHCQYVTFRRRHTP